MSVDGRRSFLLIFGLVGVVVSAAVGQNAAVISVNVAQQNGTPIDVVLNPDGPSWSINPDSQFVMAQPGDELTLEVFVRCWSDANGLPMGAYQVTFPYGTYFNGVSGNVLPKDFGTTTDPNGLCPGNLTDNQPNPANAFVFPFRDDYVFFGNTVFPTLSTAQCNYILGAAITSGPRIGVCPNIPPKYAITMNVTVSDDASGLFQVCPDPNPNATKLRGISAFDVIEPIEFECAWIQVGTCGDDAFCDNGVFCDGQETCQSGQCVAGAPPCDAGVVCNEDTDICEPPVDVPCVDDSECDNGDFCDGAETCDLSGKEGVCVDGTPPCDGSLCDEVDDRCCLCLTDADCSDGLFCNGAEVCDTVSCNECGAGTDPCNGGECDEGGGTCVGNCDLTILDSTPLSGAIDARQPSELDGTNPQGWDSVAVLFDGDAACLTAGDFTVTVTPDDVAAPSVVSITAEGTFASLGLDGRIPVGHWTQITHSGGSSICLGYLPADVTGDGTSSALDILRVIDCLNGVQTCELYQGDLNRSNASNAQDILTVIDLLNGAGSFDPWNGVSIGASPCP